MICDELEIDRDNMFADNKIRFGIIHKDTPIVTYWCNHCEVPIIKETTESKKLICPVCGSPLKYLARDLRPVFPQERRLMEILLGKPLYWKDKIVWCNTNRYYVNGQTKVINFKDFLKKDVEDIICQLNEYKNIEDKNFKENIALFCLANRNRMIMLENEAFSFIKNEATKFSMEQLMISFSGGKDSTVVADLVKRALSNPYIAHVYGDTTLEFPMTYDYLTRYRMENPRAIIKIAKNSDQKFFDVCKDIGPPARMMRWCCTMFKTGPITRAINSLYRGGKILTFYGIRRSESISRSKYDRVASNADVKIQKQTVASPIFYWNDIDVWLYILSNELDFNDAYKLGYDRVGCWCCPNNNVRAQVLSSIYMPEQSQQWRDYLISFAKSIGKPDPEEYIDGGWWKARQGGNGLRSSEDIKIKFTNCTAEENAKVYSLNKPIDESFYDLFIPLGKVNKELGRKIIHEIIILDVVTNVPIISIQPFNQVGYEYAVKIKTMNVEAHDSLQRMIGYQIRKYNACRKCLKCESICEFGAISIDATGYHIDEKKCCKCKKCVKPKYLAGGCLMERFLKIKKDN